MVDHSSTFSTSYSNPTNHPIASATFSRNIHSSCPRPHSLFHVLTYYSSRSTSRGKARPNSPFQENPLFTNQKNQHQFPPHKILSHHTLFVISFQAPIHSSHKIIHRDIPETTSKLSPKQTPFFLLQVPPHRKP